MSHHETAALGSPAARRIVPWAAAGVTLGLCLVAPLQSHGHDVTAGRLGGLTLACAGSFDLRGIEPLAQAAGRGTLPYYLTRSRTGEVVSSFGPGPAVITAPWVRSLVPGGRVGDRALLRRARYGAAFAVALSCGLLALALLAEGSPAWALGLALAAGCSFAGAATLGQAPWQQTAALPCVTAALAALAWSRRRPTLAALALALAVTAVALRPPAAALLLGVAAGAGLTLGRDLRRWLLALPLTALLAAPLVAWNLRHHGLPLAGGQHAANALIAGSDGVWTAAPATLALRLAALAASPARGLLWFAPLALVALAHALRRGDGVRRAVALGALAHALVVAAFFQWHGGPGLGPRLLAEWVWIAPWLVARPSGPWRRGIVLAALWTILVGLTATLRLDPRRWELQHDLRTHPADAWQWRDGPLPALLLNDPVGAPLHDGPLGPYIYCAPLPLRVAPSRQVPQKVW
jgi:hypothetical protein